MEQPINEYPSLHHLYPSLSAEELRIAQESIDRYLHLILRVCKRLEATKEKFGSTMNSEQ